MNKTKITLIIEVVFLLGIFVFLFFSTAPRQLYPLQGMTVSEKNFLFEIENSEEIMLSSNENFSNFIVLKEGDERLLPPGIYFWKVKGLLRDSEIRNFTLQSEASLNLMNKGDFYEIENSGNVDLNLTKNTGKITVATILNIGESKEFEKDNSTYEGKQI
jgi:hypothetical protein